MILGIGSDITHIPRVARAIESPRFLERVYTARERAYEAVERIDLEGAQYRTDIAQAASEGSVSSVSSVSSAASADRTE